MNTCPKCGAKSDGGLCLRCTDTEQRSEAKKDVSAFVIGFMTAFFISVYVVMVTSLRGMTVLAVFNIYPQTYTQYYLFGIFGCIGNFIAIAWFVSGYIFGIHAIRYTLDGLGLLGSAFTLITPAIIGWFLVPHRFFATRKTMRRTKYTVVVEPEKIQTGYFGR